MEIKETVKELIKNQFSLWLNTPHHEYQDDTVLSRFCSDYDSDIEEMKEMLEDGDDVEPRFPKVNSKDEFIAYVSNYDNWEMESDEEMLEDLDNYALDHWEHLVRFNDAIERHKTSGKEAVILRTWIDELADNYDLSVVLNHDQTEVLSWSLHQD